MKQLHIMLTVLLGAALVTAAPQDKSETDWDAKITKKQAEIEDLIKILNPVVAAVTEALEAGRTNEIIEEDWADAVHQLTTANDMYSASKERIEKGERTKLLFLNMENAWQYYVKAGVAGVRAKAMIDALPE